MDKDNNMDENLYVIVDEMTLAKEPLFWSNESGFGYLSTASFFTKEEGRHLSMPIGGKWVPLRKAIYFIEKTLENL